MKADHLFFEGVRISRTSPRRPARHVRADRPPEPERVGSFFTSLLGMANLPVNSYRSRPLQRRLPACLRFLRTATPEEARRKIEASPELARATLGVVMLGVTEFFRDRAVFDRIRDTVLPELQARHSHLRIWSAACSAGPELYSVAMLLAETGRLRECTLRGTDCRSEAIAQARAGVFGPATMASLEPRWRKRYFVPTRQGDVVNPELRWSTEWRTVDLFTAVEPGPWHLILWRNMAIYLETPAATSVWRRLCDELAPGGFIVTGKADHPPVGLPLVRVNTCIYRKQPQPHEAC